MGAIGARDRRTDAVPSRARVRWIARPSKIAVLLVVAWCVANLVWFQVHRSARLWDHEEVTYAQSVLLFATRPVGDWSGVLFSGHYGPMHALLGAPSQWVLGPNEATVIWVNIFLTGCNGLITYWVVRRLADPAAGIVACALVLLTPGMLENARGALTMVPATTFAALAVAALVAGSGMGQRRWSIVLGVAIGCMSLSRPMSVAFLPGLVVPAVAWSLDSGTPTRTIARNGLLAGLAAILVSGWWWVVSYDDVLDYLSTGAEGVGTGTASEVLDHRLYELQAYLGPVSFPNLLGFTALIAGTGYVLLLAFRPTGTPAADDARADRATLPLWPLGAAVVVNLVVSLASNTIGWLMLPLVPWIIVVAVVAARRRLRPSAWHAWTAVVLGPVVVLAVLTSTWWAEPGNRFTWCMEPWQHTSACAIDDRGEAAAWKASLREIAGDMFVVHDELVVQGRDQTGIAIAARDHIVLPATLRFQAYVDQGRWGGDELYLPRDLSVGLQVDEVRERAGVVVVSPDVEPVSLFHSMVDPDELGAELLEGDFAACREVPLPDGRVVQILVRQPLPQGACS